MNPGTVLVKTEKGRAEIQERTVVLNAVQRRLLILADGKRTVNELGSYVRVGECDAALAYLVEFGYLIAQGEPVSLPPPVAKGFASQEGPNPVRPATSPKEFEDLRDQASQFIHDRLGDAAAPICAAVDRCTSPQELRQVLRGVEVFVGQRIDASTAQNFARHFGAMLL